MRLGITITKSVLFRGVQQEFHNTYHYELLGAQTGPYESLVDELVTTEKTFHSSDVSFKRAAVWSAGGSIAQNQMVFQKTLTGTGGQSVNIRMDRERAVLIRWRAGVDSRGKPVYLRKWYHSCGSFAGNAFIDAQLQNTAALDNAQRTAIASAASAMNELGVSETWDLCSESGRIWESQPECHEYLEHHQLGDMWR